MTILFLKGFIFDEDKKKNDIRNTEPQSKKRKEIKRPNLANQSSVRLPYIYESVVDAGMITIIEQ